MSFVGDIRDVLLDSLVHYCEICTRLKKYTEAKSIITKVFNEMPQDYHKPFISKFNMIDKIENPELYDKFGKKKEDSEFGEILKGALKNSKKD